MSHSYHPAGKKAYPTNRNQRGVNFSTDILYCSIESLIERDLGRSPNQKKNSPRTIDIDLLYCDDIALSEPDLTRPHPRIAGRRFVLRPLADIRPKLILPHLARNVEELVANLKSDESVEVYCNVIY